MSKHILKISRNIQTLSRHIEAYLDTSTQGVHKSRHGLVTIMITLEKVLKERRKNIFYKMVLKGMFLCVIRTCIST